MQKIDPTLKTIVFTYTDTDSLHITGQAYKILKGLGLIVPKSESKLGYLCSDIDNQGLIIAERNLAPKSYYYEYINDKDELFTNDDAKFKAKGIPGKCMHYSFYLDDKPHDTKFSGLKKVHTRRTGDQIEKGIGHFSIINNEQKRTFCLNQWTGFDYRDNLWLPKGYQGELRKF